MKRRLVRVWPVLLLAGFCVADSGCGSGQIALKGTVTYDGKPVEDGSISFDPEDGKGPTAGGKIVEGKYDILIPPEAAGKKIVRIRGGRKTGRKIEAGMPAPKGTLIDEMVFLPPVYGDKSTLKAEITAGQSKDLDFDLKPAK